MVVDQTMNPQSWIIIWPLLYYQQTHGGSLTADSLTAYCKLPKCVKTHQRNTST